MEYNTTDKNQPIQLKGQNFDPPAIKTATGHSLYVDYELLGKELEDTDLTEDEKKELIDLVCWMMLAFVDMGFGIESTQQAMLAGKVDRVPTALPFFEIIKKSQLAGNFNSAIDEKLYNKVDKTEVCK